MKERRDLYLIAISILFWGLGEGLFFIFQPLYMQELGASSIMIGTILGINSVGMGFLSIPIGYISDRYGKRLMLWLSWFLGVIATIVMGFANNLTIFVVGFFIYGLTAAVIAPMNSYAAAARGNWSVGKAVSFISAAYNVGAVVGPMVGGALAERFDLSMLYKIAAGIFMISTIIVLFIRNQPVEKRDELASDKGLHRNPRFVLALVIILVVMFALYLPYPLTSNFLASLHITAWSPAPPQGVCDRADRNDQLLPADLERQQFAMVYCGLFPGWRVPTERFTQICPGKAICW